LSDFEESQLQVVDTTAAARMVALRRYAILDTDRDAVFDGIAEIAAALLDAPIAVVNFIADDRQWFKAEIGIGQRELPLDVSICRIALPERGIFVVPDLSLDDRFSRNPLVNVAKGLRFYAGTVLESDGVSIGTVCVLDTEPRAGGISAIQRRGLEALAVQAMAALERSAAAGRDRYRLALTERLRDAVDAQAMMASATEALGQYLGVAQVGFAEVEDDQAHVRVHRDWNDGCIASVVGRWHIDDFGPGFIRDIKSGQTIVIPDVELDARTNSAEALANFARIGTRALLNIGLIRDGQMRALLFTHHHQPRSWVPADIEIVRETVERLWAAVERARAEDRLIQSEAVARTRAEQIEAIYSAAPVGLAVLDSDLRYVNVNERLAEINGVPVADHIGRTVREVVPDLGAQAVEAFDRVLAGQEIIGTEFVGTTAAEPGITRTWRSNWLPMRDEVGRVVGVTLSAEETTKEKAAQEALKASEARLGREFERADIAQKAARAAFYEFDPQTGIGMPSPNLTELTGHAHQPTITLQWWQSLVHPSDLERFSAAIEAAALLGQDYALEYRLRHRDGHWLWVSDRGRIVQADDDGRTCVIGMVLNIDDQRQAQLALAESEALLRSVLDASPDCIKSAGLDGRLEFMNANGMCAMEIDALGEIAGAEWASLWPPEAREQVDRAVEAAGTGQSTRFEAYCPTAKGTPKWWDVAVAPVHDVDGTPKRIVSVSREITDRVQVELQLRASEALFRTLTETLPALIFIADADGANVYSNSEFSAYTGLDGSALLGDGWIELLHPDDRERAAQTWSRSWRGGQPYETNYRFRSAAGDYRTFLVRGSPVRDDRGIIVQWVGYCTDIDELVTIRDDLAAARAALIAVNADLETQVVTRTSELVRANRKLQAEIKRREATQAALVQGQKLEALGQLTAGIAHDFNNILAAIAGGMDLIARRVEDEKVKYITGHCKEAAFRGASLVKQMLAFARQEVLAPRSAKLAQLANEIAPLIRQAIPGNIVSIDFPADLPPVLIDPVLLETALLNLAVNARDAMPGGGTLSLAANLSRPGDRNHPVELKAVEAIAIAVRDTGEGMPPEVVQRVTEPFFTTKAPGKGTGLGLAMVYGFINQSGGAMHIDSRVGKGTTITLYLPLATALGEVEPVATAFADTAVPTGIGYVLLVDDDAAVRAVAAEQLRDLGYTIIEADGYAAAMTRIEAGDRFDCVVSDVVMPGGDGVALAAAIRSSRPGLPILFMTGRADGKRVAGEQVLHKPFKLIELAKAVADVIQLPHRERAMVTKIASRSRARCVADMLDHWSAGKFAAKVPHFATFDADACSEPHKLAVVMADASQLPMQFRVLSAGKELEALLGRPMKEDEFDVRGADGFGSAEESYRRAVKTCQPVFDYMKMDFGDGVPERFERLILPYSSEGGLVDRLVSVVVFADDA
jgi:PAS domain S-box-containing protein